VVIPAGHCHHLSVECLAITPTGKSYPPLRQEMQEAFRPEQGQGETFLLSFSAMRKKVSKERIADTALSASSFSIPMVSTLILYFLLASLTIWLFHHHILC